MFYEGFRLMQSRESYPRQNQRLHTYFGKKYFFHMGSLQFFGCTTKAFFG